MTFGVILATGRNHRAAHVRFVAHGGLKSAVLCPKGDKRTTSLLHSALRMKLRFAIEGGNLSSASTRINPLRRHKA
jgi:hypothetical protein